MAPVETHGVDSPVNEIGQLVSTVLTLGLALSVVVWVITMWRREGIVWPIFVAISGTLTCLLEPLFDHLYGLWFLEEGQWNLYQTFGSSQPVWVPLAYLFFYGGATIFVARYLTRKPTMRAVWQMYGSIVGMALAAEIAYVSILGVYEYQDSQPFVVLGYPVFLAFTNAMAAVVGGIVVHRLHPLLTTGRAQLSLIMVVPMAFAMDLFGGGILYLSIRHSVDNPPMWLMHIAALTVAGAIAATVHLLGTTLVQRRSDATATTAREARSEVVHN